MRLRLDPARPAMALLGLLLACAGNAEPRRETARCLPLASVPGPLPTEHVLDPDAERRNAGPRKAWIEAMHRAAPGTDWRALERQNGERRMQERALLRRRKDYSADTWTERGSRNLAGRMHSVAVSLDESAIYAGSDRGGVWRSAPDGSSWTPIGDSLWGGAHQVAVASSPSGQSVLALTNWGRLRYTVDDGANWLIPAGLPATSRSGKRLFTDPTDRTRVFAVLNAGPGWQVFRSLDGGVSFASVNVLGAPTDLWMDRVDGGALFLLEGTELWRSDDLGDTWLPQGSVTSPGANDVALAGSEAGAPTLMAAIRRSSGNWELHRSDDAGGAWTRQGNPPEFWGAMEAGIGDASLLALGGVEVFRSGSGGASFTKINDWWQYYANPLRRLHADLMGLDVAFIGGQETWFISTDGGIYISTDGLQTVHNICLLGLGVSQYYSTHTSRRDPSRILGGSQDQGYQRASLMGTPTADFEQLISGDYGHLTSADRTHDFVYSTYPGFILVHEGEDVPDLSQLDFPAGSRPQWLPAVVADPQDPEAFYFCADRLWRYERDPSSGEWTHFLETTQDFTAAGGSTLTKLSIAPSDPARRLAVTDSGALWYSDDGGFDWQPSADRGPDAHYFYGTALEHSPDDAATAIVAGSGYSGPAAWRTRDGGRSWSPLGAGLPPTLVYDIAWERPGSGIVFAATEAGPYRLDPATETWEHVGGSSSPLTTYWSVESIPEIGVARFGTYGRGIWDWQQAVVPEAGNCGDGVDNEGDGLVDCDDPDCVGSFDCRERCDNGLDDDRDGLTDCDDPDCVTADSDGDGRGDCDGSDCAPSNPLAWATPGEIRELRVAPLVPGTDDVRLTWTDEHVAAAGPGIWHDVVVGSLVGLRPAGWPAGGLCLRNDSPAFEHDDSTAGMDGIWYLVRAQNACSAGAWGSGDAGPAQPLPGCP